MRQFEKHYHQQLGRPLMRGSRPPFSPLLAAILSLSQVSCSKPPKTWDEAFGNRSREVWDIVSRDGIVTASEIIEESYKGPSHHDGDRQLATAIALISINDDPIPALRKMMEEKAPERRAFAATTAGLVADKRFRTDLEKLQSDRTPLGQFPGDWFWDTVGDAAERAQENLASGGITKSAKEHELAVAEWHQALAD